VIGVFAISQQKLECKWKTSTVRQMLRYTEPALSQLSSDNVLAHFSYFFFRPIFQVVHFLFSSPRQLGRTKCNVATGTEILKGEILSHKHFSGKCRKIRAKFSLHAKKIACSYTYETRWTKALFRSNDLQSILWCSHNVSWKPKFYKISKTCSAFEQL